MDIIDYMEWKTGLNIRDAIGISPELMGLEQPISPEQHLLPDAPHQRMALQIGKHPAACADR